MDRKNDRRKHIFAAEMVSGTGTVASNKIVPLNVSMWCFLEEIEEYFYVHSYFKKYLW
jgi:hypothetical protein